MYSVASGDAVVDLHGRKILGLDNLPWTLEHVEAGSEVARPFEAFVGNRFPFLFPASSSAPSFMFPQRSDYVPLPQSAKARNPRSEIYDLRVKEDVLEI